MEADCRWKVTPIYNKLQHSVIRTVIGAAQWPLRLIHYQYTVPPVRDFSFRLLKTGLAIGAIGYLMYVVEPNEMMAALKWARWEWVAGALALMPLTLTLDGVVWRRLLRPVVAHPTARQLAGAVLSGFALGFVTPARAGEFVGRALYLPEADAWTVGLTIFVQRLIDTAINVAVGIGALGGVLYIGLLESAWAWTLVLIGGGAFALLLIGFLAAPSSAARLARWLAPHRTAIHERVDVLQTYRHRTMAWATGWAGLRYVVFCTQFVLLIYAFAPEPALHSVFGAVALTFFAKFLIPSVTLMDLGIQEGAAVFFLGLFGVSPAAAFNAALLLFLINIVLPTLAGLPFVWPLRPHRDQASSPVAPPSPASAEMSSH